MTGHIHRRTEMHIASLLKDPAQAIGIYGEQGSGKGFIASKLAAELLQIDEYSLLNHPYVAIVDAAETKGGIDAVRDIQKLLHLKVPGSKIIRRIVILEHIDHFKHEAQNALLKTLEEPPQDTVILCTYSLPQRVLTTIHSRLRQITILPLSQVELIGDNPTKDQIRAYHVSGGLPGLYTALINKADEHPLLLALAEARALLSMSKYNRLATVDKLSKHKSVTAESLVQALYRLIRASYSQKMDATTAMRMQCIENAMSDISQNVQTKLVLSRLFQEL
jgi:DNA polymerase III delta prime subunit